MPFRPALKPWNELTQEDLDARMRARASHGTIPQDRIKIIYTETAVLDMEEKADQIEIQLREPGVTYS